MMRRLSLRFGSFAAGLFALAAMVAPAAAQSLEERGAYLATIMDCTGCHTGGALAGQPDPALYLAGSDIGFALPGLGVFYPPNLTPDAETGLGRWSAEQIIHAVRTGERPDGRILAPIMPYHSYAKLTDADAAALAAYLKSLPAVSHKAPGPFGPEEKATAPYLAPMMPE